MITLRCTRKLLRLVDRVPTEDPPAPTSALGDWYANVVSTVAGDLIVFANEQTLLSIALPVEMADVLITGFVARYFNLLMTMGIPEDIALLEHDEAQQVTFAKTASRQVLGSLTEIAHYYRLKAKRSLGHGAPSLSETELFLTRFVHRPLDGEYPADVSKRLLAEHYGHWE